VLKPAASPADSAPSDAAPPSAGGVSRYVPPSRRGGDAAPLAAATSFVEGDRQPSSRYPQDGRYAPSQPQRGGGFEQRPADSGGRWERPGRDSGRPFDRPREGGGGGGGRFERDAPRDSGRSRYEGSGFRGPSDFSSSGGGPPGQRFGGGHDAALPPEERREFLGGPPPPAAPVEVDHERFKALAPSDGDYPSRRPPGQFPGAFGGGGGPDGGYERPPMPAAFQGGRDGGGYDRQMPAAFQGGRDGDGYDRQMPAAFHGGGRDGGGYDRQMPAAFQGGGRDGGGNERREMPAAFQMGGGRRDREEGSGSHGGAPGGSSRWMGTGDAGGGGHMDRSSGGGFNRRAPPPPTTEGGKQELGNFIGKSAPAVSSNALHHAKPAAPPAPEPVADDAVQAAAALGVSVSRATMAKKLRPVLDEFLTDTSKQREKKATTGIGALRTPEISADLTRIFVEHSLQQEKSGDRKQLAGLLNALRAVKPIPLVSDAEVGSALSAAVTSAAGGPGSDAGARIKHFVDELGKAPKGALALSALPADVQAFVSAAAAAAEATAAAAAAAAAAEAESTGAAAGSAAASTTSSAAAVSADVADEASSVDVAEVAAWLIKMDGKGLALRSEAQEKLVKVPAAKAAGPVMAAVLKVRTFMWGLCCVIGSPVFGD
jgi:hypothetical protein